MLLECLYIGMMARMLKGDTSVPNTLNTRSWFKHDSPAIKRMPQSFLQDLIRLLHFVDNWYIDDDEN